MNEKMQHTEEALTSTIETTFANCEVNGAQYTEEGVEVNVRLEPKMLALVDEHASILTAIQAFVESLFELTSVEFVLEADGSDTLYFALSE